MAFAAYQPSVRIGNWNEDICLEEDLIRAFLRKKEQGALYIQQNINLKESFERRISTTVTKDGFVHFNDVVMLLMSGSPPGFEPYPGDSVREECVLALTAPIEEMYKAKSINFECGVCGCLRIYPQPRTTFRVVPLQPCTSTDVPVRFGDAFMLMPLAGDNLYLSADMKTFSKHSEKSRHHEVTLVPERSFTTMWKFLPYDPRVRFEFEGIPVPANEKLLICHIKTNEVLAIEDQFTFRTPFGREYEISVHTYVDSHKAERELNHWTVVMATSDEDTPLHEIHQNLDDVKAVQKDQEAKIECKKTDPLQSTYVAHYKHPADQIVKTYKPKVQIDPPLSNYIWNPPSPLTKAQYENITMNSIPPNQSATTDFTNPADPEALVCPKVESITLLKSEIASEPCRAEDVLDLTNMLLPKTNNKAVHFEDQPNTSDTVDPVDTSRAGVERLSCKELMQRKVDAKNKCSL